METLWRSRGMTVSLVAIWLAVPLVGLFGGNIVTETGDGDDRLRSTVPAVVPVAAFAAAATFFVGWFASRAEKTEAAPAAERETERTVGDGRVPAEGGLSVAGD